MNIQTIPPNHKIFRTGDDTAMIAFESGPFPDPQMVPRIHLYSRSQYHRPYLDDGQVFGHGTGNSHVLFIKATPLSIIQVIEWHPGKRHMAETRYQVGPDFEITQVPTNARKTSSVGIQDLLHASPASSGGNLILLESDTKLLFSDVQPPWLKNIIDAQLTHWRIHHVDLYFRHTYWQLNQEDIWHGVKAAPYWVLARWKNRLKPYQIDLCVRASPRGAVSFAPERLSRYQREQYLEKYPEDALTHASDKLTHAELMMCANREPDAALSLPCRRNLPPQLRATLLAGSYRKLRKVRMSGPVRDLQRELLDSIIEQPEEWLTAHRGGFAEVMEGLASHLSIRPEGMVLLDMGDRMQPPHQKAFAAYLGSLI